jgi:hypothetical protein
VALDTAHKTMLEANNNIMTKTHEANKAMMHANQEIKG